MIRLGFVIILFAVLSCSGSAENNQEEEETDFNYSNFSKRFRNKTVPYSLSDTALLNNKDTAAIRNPVFQQYIPDSLLTKIFGSSARRVRLIPVAQFSAPGGESYFIIKAASGRRVAAMLIAFNKEQKYGAALPFLVPDSDPATAQVSTVDKVYSINRNITRKSEDVLKEGKEVYVYNTAARQFTLIMTDVLDDKEQELINPIDTFSRKHHLAGDYIRNKKNIVSMRDGRNENELLFFIHFENEGGECIGELSGTALMTSTTTAVYRRGGDPCVLEFIFKPSAVTLHEVEGCGSHRGVKCTFDGTYPKKKETKTKTKPASGKK